MKAFKNLLLLVLITLLSVPNGKAQSTAEEDFLLGILKQQVEENFQSFLKKEKVYLLSYRVEKNDRKLLYARSGSLIDQQHTQQSWLTIQIRVGNTFVDNYSPLGDASDEAYLHTKVIPLPLDDNDQIITDILKRETAIAYQEARVRYHKALAMTNGQSAKTNLCDYMVNIPTSHYEPPVDNYVFQTSEMIEELKASSGAVTPSAEVNCRSSLIFENNRRYFVNSEGMAIVENNIHSRWNVVVSGQASDGTPIALSKQYDAEFPDEFPVVESVIRDVQEMETALQPLTLSTRAGAAFCPVVFAGSAASAFWQSTLVPYLIDYNGEVGHLLLPEEITIISDPTNRHQGDCRLLGSYRFDDEGTPAEPLTLVENGRLRAGLYACESSRGGHPTNGHGRAVPGHQPTPTPANLMVTTTRPLSDAELREALKKELQRTNCPFGYWVEEMTLDKQNRLRPQVVKKIFANNHADEIVHGLEFTGTPRSLLSQVTATGNLVNCFEQSHNGIAYHCCTPAVMLRQVESRPTPIGESSPAIISFVYDGGQLETTDQLSDILFQVVDAEMSAATEQLKEHNEQLPFYISYLVTDGREYHVESVRGSILSATERPLRGIETQVLIGSNLQNSGRLLPDPDVAPNFPLDNNYNAILKCLAEETDRAYKKARHQMAEKTEALQLLGDSVAITRPMDRISAWVTNVEQIDPVRPRNLNQLQMLADELSQQFNPYSFLNQSGVKVDAMHGTAYFKGTDGVQYAQPVALLRVRIWAEILTLEGRTISDYKDLLYHDIQEITDVSELYIYIVEMAERLKAYQSAPCLDEISYSGPVLMADEAAAQMFAQAFTESEPNLFVNSSPLTIESVADFNKKATQSYENKIDKRIVHRSLDIDALNTMTTYDGIPLIGSYYIDADGIKSEEKREIIRHGELVTMLTTRLAAGRQEESNGHLRLALRGRRLVAEPGVGVLELSGSHRLDDKRLMKTLCKKARTAGYKYAFVIHKCVENEKGEIQLFAGQVNTITGKETPVCIMIPLKVKISDFEMLSAVSNRKMVYNALTKAANDQTSTATSSLNGVASSFIVPDKLLFDKLNLLKTSEN